MMPGMDFEPSDRCKDFSERLHHVHGRAGATPPSRCTRRSSRSSATRTATPPVLEELKAEARARGLWNLFLPTPSTGPGLSYLEYAPLAEITGASACSRPRRCNCAAPDTGNMEVLHPVRHRRAEGAVAAAAARRRDPLGVRDDRARGRVAPTPPTSDPDRARRRRVRASTAASGGRPARARPALPDPHRDGQDRPGRRRRTGSSRWSWCPIDTPGRDRRAQPPGVRVRTTSTATASCRFDGRPRAGGQPASAGEGDGFAIAQARLGPGRIHHCMRAIGTAERALELMVDRVAARDDVRRAAGRAGRRPGLDRRVAHRDRAGAAARASRPPG